MIHHRRSYWVYFDPDFMRAHLFPSVREHPTPGLEFIGEYRVSYVSAPTSVFLKWVKTRLQLLGINYSHGDISIQEHPC